MNFASIEYLLLLPIVFIAYWSICRKSKTLQNGLIVIASLVFYGWWDWRFLGLLFLVALSTFFAGALEQRYDNNAAKRRWINIAAIVLNIGILFYFKYVGFFIEAICDALRLAGYEPSISSLKIILPIGISFYTLTALSYPIDVYQRKIPATRDILAYFAYVMFFPAILSGPISIAKKHLPQYFNLRVFDYDKAVSGCKLMIWGGVMKFCMADRLGIYIDAVYQNIPQHNGTTLLISAFLYSLQLYGDFAGYSLIAIGSAKLLGIDLPTNFIRPYFSKTITEFWGRWHISLTTWFREYVYFPLGGNRVSKSRWIFNIMVVFIVSGLWHGAAYTYLVWGTFHGLCMVIEKTIYGNKIKYISDKFSLPNILRVCLTFSLVSFALIIFRASSLSDAFLVISKIFTDSGSPFIVFNTLTLAALATILVIAYDTLSATHMTIPLIRRPIFRFLLYALLISYILGFGVLSNASFIYFQF